MKSLLPLLLFALLAGCSTAPSDPPPTSIRPLDAAKVDAAKMNLKTDAELGSAGITVKAENDLLVMNGTVGSKSAKEKAEALVRKVPGITKVANHLEVQGGPPSSEGTPGADGF